MKRLILVSISSLLLAGCYHTAGGPAPVEQPVPAEEVKTMQEAQEMEKNTVIYDDNGFTPKALTIKVGSTVTWKNSGNKTMWVASAVHPTHQELPGLDQLEATGNGTTYNYTFTKPGTWKYHNHVAPSDTGTVVVEE